MRDQWQERARELARLSRTALSHHDLAEVRRLVLEAARRAVPSSDGVGLTKAVPGRSVDSVSATGPLPRQSDHLQHELREGPCHDAAYGKHGFHCPDTTTDTRWPRYTRRAAALGVGSVMGFPLYTQDEAVGAVNFYAERPNAFDEDDFAMGELFAAHAAIALRWAESEAHLSAARAAGTVVDGPDRAESAASPEGS